MPNERIRKQRKVFKRYFLRHEMIQSIKAMELVDIYHVGERRNGGPESSHLYEVAGQIISFLYGRIPDADLDCVVAASFLHDLVEDYMDLYGEEHLRDDFKHMTANLVMDVCKWPGFKKCKKDYIEYYVKMSISILSVFIKVADRIHNLSTCYGAMSIERIIQYINETETYIYPMIKSSRKYNPALYMVLTNMKQQLEREITSLRKIIELSQTLALT